MMEEAVKWFAWFFFVMHGLAACWTYFRNPTKIDRELVVQHHELCEILALVVLAIIYY